MLTKATAFIARLVRPLAMGFVVGAVCVVAALAGAFASWSERAWDQMLLPHAPHARLVVVTIDDVSLEALGRWPWDRGVHAEVIRRIAAGRPAAIGYDVTFAEPQDAYNDALLAQAMQDAGNVVLPIETALAEGSVWPLSLFQQAAARIGHVTLQPDEDGVVRRVAVTTLDDTGEAHRFFAHEVLRVAGVTVSIPPAPLLRIAYPGGAGTVESISAADVANGSVSSSVFAGKIVFVGATAPSLHDTVLSPFGVLSGVETHASLADTLLSQRFLMPVPIEVAAMVIFALALLAALAAAWLRMRWGIPAVFLLLIVLIGVAALLFERGFVLDILWPAIATVASFGLVSLERRWAAERERREIQNVFSRYMSPSVVEALLEDPSKLALGGTRRHMTVFFSDIRGFTSLSETMKPERLVRVLNAYLDRMTHIVFAHGGVLDKYIGDAVMAFWNAPLDQPDHARRAVATALAMRVALREMNEQHKFGKAELRIGVGINTGDMVVGNIGGTERVDYTVIGDSVNLGSRLEGLTKEYGVDILISESTAEEAGSEILVRKLDKAAVKGKKEPVILYEALALASQATATQKALVADFEDALEKYFARDFAGATAECAAILKRHPDDGPTKLLLQRCAKFIQVPPPKQWDGTWVFLKK